MTTLTGFTTDVKPTATIDLSGIFSLSRNAMTIVPKEEVVRNSLFVDAVFVGSIADIILSVFLLLLSITNRIPIHHLVFLVLLLAGIGLCLTVYFKKKDELP